jgi:Zn-dependent protease with chaperone function
MRSFLGTYNAPGSAPSEATILVFEKAVHIGHRNEQGHNLTEIWDIGDISAVFSMAEQGTRIRNTRSGNATILIPGNAPAAFIADLQTELNKRWHKKSKAKELGRNLLLFLGIVGGLVALYFLFVPWMSGKLASKVSIDTEEQFGEAVYSGLNIEGLEDTAASEMVNRFFNTMDVNSNYHIRIAVVKGETVNAFALPGGRIVVYDALLEKMESYPELAALLAHEFTHVNNKHSTKSIFRRLGSRIFLSMLFGKIGSVTSVLFEQADNLKSLKYSRSLEKEADLEGLTLLTDRKIDPKGFSDLFRHLKQSAPASVVPEILGSHPDTDSRIAYLQQAAQNVVVEENQALKTIFESLKQKIQQ